MTADDSDDESDITVAVDDNDNKDGFTVCVFPCNFESAVFISFFIPKKCDT